MEFLYSPDERELIEEAGRIIKASLGIERFREGDTAVSGWARVGEAGWLHGMLAEEDGGANLPLVLMAGIAREAGMVLAVEEFTNNAFLLPSLLRFVGDDDRDDWLASHLERPGFIVADGRSRHVTADGYGTEQEIVAAPWSYGVWGDFDAYVLSPLAKEGCRLLRISDGLTDLQPIAQLGLGVGSVEVRDGVRSVTSLSVSDEDLSRVIDGALVIHSAGLVGLAARALDETSAYVKVREQFGQPVGRFQATKHRLADVYVRVEVAWNSVLYAALSCTRDDISSARLKSIDAAMAATKAMIQLLGGVGFTWEHDAHWFLKSALAGSKRFGGRRDESFSLGQGMVARST